MFWLTNKINEQLLANERKLLRDREKKEIEKRKIERDGKERKTETQSNRERKRRLCNL